MLINYLRPSSASLLLLCGFLFVFTETLLSPFYPQFFAQVFGVTDPGMAGEFVTLCRLSVLLCAPLWGLMTRWVSPLKILIFTQSTAAVITFFMAQASTLKAFVILSVLLMAFKSSYFLFYSLLVELGGQAKNLQSVASVQLVVHLALIASSLGSVWVINSVNPLAMFQLIALLDVIQVGLCYWVLSRANSSARQSLPAAASSLGERTTPSRAQQTGHPQPQNDQQSAILDIFQNKINQSEIEETGHPLDGRDIQDKIIIYPKGSGSTVAPYVLMGLVYTGKGPKAIVTRDICSLTLPACSLLNVPYSHGFDSDPCLQINDGDRIRLAKKGAEVQIDVLQRVGE